MVQRRWRLSSICPAKTAVVPQAVSTHSQLDYLVLDIQELVLPSQWLSHTAGMRPSLLLSLLLAIAAASLALADVPPSGRGDVRVVTTDAVPDGGVGKFHFVAVDDQEAPRFVFVSDTANHVVWRKDLAQGEREGTAAVAASTGRCSRWRAPGGAEGHQAGQLHAGRHPHQFPYN